MKTKVHRIQLPEFHAHVEGGQYSGRCILLTFALLLLVLKGDDGVEQQLVHFFHLWQGHLGLHLATAALRDQPSILTQAA